MENKPERYCTECGKKCDVTVVSADSVTLDYGEYCRLPLDYGYDPKTGEKNVCFKYTCPEYKKAKWWQKIRHDNYTDNEVIKITP